MYLHRFLHFEKVLNVFDHFLMIFFSVPVLGLPSFRFGYGGNGPKVHLRKKTQSVSPISDNYTDTKEKANWSWRV